jgi:hypothetical protein
MTARKRSKPRLKRRVERRLAAPQTREQRQQADHRRMVDLIARTKAQAEREAEADWLIARAAESVYGGPMLGELLRGEAYDELAARIGEPSSTLQRGTTLKRGAGR